MAEIKVNEYVRTELGIIYKYTEDEKNDLQLRDFRLCNDGKIVKHNKIISEVVEVGDYVNGKLIHKIDKGPNYCYLYYGNCKTFVDYQIKTILTKEQMEANCYKVGGEDE